MMFELEDSIYLRLDPNDYFQCMMFYGLYSPEILRIIRLYVRGGESVVDVGAHVGYFSLYLGKLVGADGHVYAFEPDERARASLETSVAVNRMPWITVFPQALAAKKEPIQFMLSPQVGWSTGVQNSHLTGLRSVRVESVPLDLLVEEGYVDESIRFIKVDVEGFEMDVLRGMSGVLERSRPIVLLEANQLMLRARGDNVGGLIARLATHGYEAWAIARRRHTLRSMPACFMREVFEVESFEGDLFCFPKERKRFITESLGQ